MGNPWLQIVGVGEDGVTGLSDASRDAFAAAEVVFGGPRHLGLVGTRGRVWPVPFDVAPVLQCRGQRVVVLVSGDPFWFGAGASLVPHLTPGEWVAHPAPSTFAWAASRLGWSLETTACHGLHAAPFARIRADLQNRARLICLLRDGAAPAALAAWLVSMGFGASVLHVLEALGGPRERVRQVRADGFDLTDVVAPVAVAIDAIGAGLPRGFGLPDDLFAHDGQITKRVIRAMTLASLAPRPGERLWDIGAGSGSISVEWCLAGAKAVAVEAKPARAVNIRANAAGFGIEHRLSVVEGAAPDALLGLPTPDAVFVGGGGDAALYDALWPLLPPGARLIANSVTLETEALLVGLRARHGGQLTRIDVAEAGPLGRMLGWNAARPVVQWSVVR
ncbi:MAG: precorrin-6y C5,15-methyltransferase (decarboxylating) subunit CbiE [Paracoccaceae bacterium]